LLQDRAQRECARRQEGEGRTQDAVSVPKPTPKAASSGRAGDLDTAAVLPDRRAERRRLAEPDPAFGAFCARKGLPASSTLQLERARDAWQAERYRRGETGQRPGYADNPFRPR